MSARQAKRHIMLLSYECAVFICINRKAPYLVSISKIRSNYFDFSTNSGVRYSIGFDEDGLLQSDESYQLIIVNVNNRPSPRDAKVRDTIIAIIDEFFSKNNVTMLYICETADGKQQMRSRLFQYWFSTYTHKSDFILVNSSVKDAEGIDNYATIILRKDNPNLKDVLSEFADTITLLSEKS